MGFRGFRVWGLGLAGLYAIGLVGFRRLGVMGFGL